MGSHVRGVQFLDFGSGREQLAHGCLSSWDLLTWLHSTICQYFHISSAVVSPLSDGESLNVMRIQGSMLKRSLSLSFSLALSLDQCLSLSKAYFFLEMWRTHMSVVYGTQALPLKLWLQCIVFDMVPWPIHLLFWLWFPNKGKITRVVRHVDGRL